MAYGSISTAGNLCWPKTNNKTVFFTVEKQGMNIQVATALAQAEYGRLQARAIRETERFRRRRCPASCKHKKLSWYGTPQTRTRIWGGQGLAVVSMRFEITVYVLCTRTRIEEQIAIRMYDLPREDSEIAVAKKTTRPKRATKKKVTRRKKATKKKVTKRKA